MSLQPQPKYFIMEDESLSSYHRVLSQILDSIKARRDEGLVGLVNLLPFILDSQQTRQTYLSRARAILESIGSDPNGKGRQALPINRVPIDIMQLVLDAECVDKSNNPFLNDFLVTMLLDRIQGPPLWFHSALIGQSSKLLLSANMGIIQTLSVQPISSFSETYIKAIYIRIGAFARTCDVNAFVRSLVDCIEFYYISLGTTNKGIEKYILGHVLNVLLVEPSLIPAFLEIFVSSTDYITLSRALIIEWAGNLEISVQLGNLPIMAILTPFLTLITSLAPTLDSFSGLISLLDKCKGNNAQFGLLAEFNQFTNHINDVMESFIWALIQKNYEYIVLGRKSISAFPPEYIDSIETKSELYSLLRSQNHSSEVEKTQKLTMKEVFPSLNAISLDRLTNSTASLHLDSQDDLDLPALKTSISSSFEETTLQQIPAADKLQTELDIMTANLIFKWHNLDPCLPVWLNLMMMEGSPSNTSSSENHHISHLSLRTKDFPLLIPSAQIQCVCCFSLYWPQIKFYDFICKYPWIWNSIYKSFMEENSILDKGMYAFFERVLDACLEFWGRKATNSFNRQPQELLISNVIKTFYDLGIIPWELGLFHCVLDQISSPDARIVLQICKEALRAKLDNDCTQRLKMILKRNFLSI